MASNAISKNAWTEKKGREIMSRKHKYFAKIKDFVQKEISHIAKDPLDGDQTEVLSGMFNIELDFQNGNITKDEYEERLVKLNSEIL